MGSKKKAGPPPKKTKESKDRYQSLMREVEKSNPEFVKWLRSRDGQNSDKKS